MSVDYKTYQSVFTWRYGSPAMRALFSEENKRLNWRKVWVALARAQNKLGLISKQEFADIEKYKNSIDIETAHRIEKEIKHDLMAEVKTYAAQAKVGGGKIHLGATSQDIEDNADALIFLNAIDLIENKLKALLIAWARQIEKHKSLVCMAYTHLQPAEPTTLGYRFSFYAQDLLLDLELLRYVKGQVKGKGLKGAVGNSASYVSLLSEKAATLESKVLGELGIDAFEVTSQVYPRKIDFIIVSLLSSIAQSLYKFAFDIRILQSAQFGEIAEPFAERQVGSSAMPFKRNPQNSERICSLARYISAQAKVAWDNAANSVLERTLDDSAARRIIVPDSFLATDEILNIAKNVVENMTINQANIQKNLDLYGPFSALESILLVSSKNGADRQKMHEILRNHSMVTYKHMAKTGQNNLFDNLKKDKRLLRYLTPLEMDSLADYKNHIGLSVKKSSQTAVKIRKVTKA